LKISELAKRVKMPSKVLLIQIIKLGITAKSAQASLSIAEMDKVLKALAKKKPSLDIEKIKQGTSAKKKPKPEADKSTKEKKQKKKAKTSKTKPKTRAAVIKKTAAAKKPAVKRKTAEKPVKHKQKSVEPVKEKKTESISIKKTEASVEPSESGKAVLRKVEDKAAFKVLQVKFPIIVKDLAQKMSIGASLIIKELMGINVFANINQLIGEDDAKVVAEKFDYQLERLPTVEEEALTTHLEEEQDEKTLMPRSPVVTLMGHVDHGKTSLLDYIRKTKVTDQETGGITQHIGAYEVILSKGSISFLDTPGHEAFTAMRARGAHATDIVVLVVAADDGLMPQTIEAIDHSRAADVPIIVAINKIDKPDVDIDKTKKQLAEIDLLPEDWGGKTITVNVSAKTGEGVNSLLEMILLEAEMLELRANPNKPARGVVVEAKISKGGGPIATILVQNGTLYQGDVVVAGSHFGKIRALLDDKIHRIKDAPPSKPVEILGLNGVPQAGESFIVVSDEKKAKEICSMRRKIHEEEETSVVQRITLEDLYSEMKRGKITELKVILKADVRGSLEAIADSLAKLGTKSMGLNIIHKGIGDINESDILLAAASNAIVIGFHVRKTPEAERAGKSEHVDIRLYNIIYEAISDIKAAMEGLLEPDIKEVFAARILVKAVLKLSKSGIVAGSIIQKGKVLRNMNCRLIRDGEAIYKGKISSLKRFKEDVKEVAEGFECGVKLENFTSIKVNDIIECFEIEKTARKL
jgi:translation initiation factor IF-2